MTCSLELLVFQVQQLMHCGSCGAGCGPRWNHQPSIAVSEQRVSVAGWLRFVYIIPVSCL